MIQSLYFGFMSAWLLSFLALLSGRYIGRGISQTPSGKKLLAIWLKVWVITFVAQVVFNVIGYAMEWSEANQSGFANFLLPVVAGAYYARQLLLLNQQRAIQAGCLERSG